MPLDERIHGEGCALFTQQVTFVSCSCDGSTPVSIRRILVMVGVCFISAQVLALAMIMSAVVDLTSPQIPDVSISFWFVISMLSGAFQQDFFVASW